MLLKAPTAPDDPRHVARYPHPDERTPRAARDWLTRALDGLDETTLDTARTVLSELATNAVRHGASPVEITADLTDGRLTLTVECSPRPVDLEQVGCGLAEHGYGLGIVAHLAAVVRHRVTAVIRAGGAL